MVNCFAKKENCVISELLLVVGDHVVVVGGGCCCWWWVIVLLLLGGNCRGSWTEYQLPCSIRYPIRLVHPLPLIPQIGGGGHLCVQRNGAILPHDVMFLETMMFCLTLFRYIKRLVKKARPEKPIGHCRHC